MRALALICTQKWVKWVGTYLLTAVGALGTQGPEGPTGIGATPTTTSTLVSQEGVGPGAWTRNQVAQAPTGPKGPEPETKPQGLKVLAQDPAPEPEGPGPGTWP